MKTKWPPYARISAILASSAILFFVLMMSGLPQKNDISGTYLNVLIALLDVIPFEKSTKIEMRAASLFAITEKKILSIFFLLCLITAMASIWTGWLAYRHKAHPKLYASSIALCVVLLLVLVHYRWILI